jgi:hypothetical protein
MTGAREALNAGWTHIERQVIALEDAINSTPGLAFDLAKTLIESTCKTVLDKRQFPYQESWDLPKLLKETLNQLRLVPESLREEEGVSESLRKVAGGLQTVIQGISELRNTYGFASHGKSFSFQQLEAHQALLVARAADTIVNFIFRVDLEYPASTEAPRPAYEDNPDFNQYVDDNNEPVRIFELEFEPSKVLFEMDPQAYEDYLENFREQVGLDVNDAGMDGGREAKM